MKQFSFLFVAINLIGCNSGAGEDTPDPKAHPVTRSPSHPVTVPVGIKPSLPSVGVDWPWFLGPTRDNKSPETGIRTKWPLKVVWQRQLGTSYGIGSISNGRMFQFDRHGDQARLSCLNSKTGKLIWKFEYPTDYEDSLGYNNGPRTSPVVDGELVYIFGAEGMLHCLKVADGDQVWTVDTAKAFGVVQNFFGVGSTPVIFKDLLIANIGGSPPESHRFGRFDLDRVVGNGTGIVAFDKKTGEVRYKATNELAAYGAPQLTNINGRDWCFVFTRAGLLGFEPSTGKVDFSYPWRARIRDSVNASTPVVVGDEVFISETYGPGSSLLKVSPGDYEVVWKDDPRAREKAMQTHWNTSIHVDGFLYGSSGRHLSNAELRCIEWKTGKVMWSIPDQTRSSLLYADGHLISLNEIGVLRLIKASPTEYREVARWDLRTTLDPESPCRSDPIAHLSDPYWAAPILSHGYLYIRGDGRLICMELISSE